MNEERNVTASEKYDSFREDFSALLDGELSAEDREAIENHLSQCSECLRALDGFQKVDCLFQALPAVDAPGRLEDAVREVLRPQAEPPMRLKRPYVHMFAAAAAVLLMAGGLAATVGVNVYAPTHVARLESGPEASAESNARESSAAAFELDVHLESEEEFVGDQAAPETALAKPLSKRGTVAVADAEPMRAPPAASVAKAKEAARVFEERDGIHYQAGYANQEL
ncbi:MAG: zf-HC2 domain-containing protein, partial [Candidatus Hydrogenedentes bacterium]|nr:zf-HC2 domain-containing protein [Candidatus Hydrogenedentota bacterium]